MTNKEIEKDGFYTCSFFCFDRFMFQNPETCFYKRLLLLVLGDRKSKGL